MRFAEKSFEVRFCAALSAALMPLNRNPQWFGMTQAEERITGIDTMLSVGGHLLVFQFKAKQGERFHLERSQWHNLIGIGSKFPNSTYYMFPEAADIMAAASVECILKHSWCCSVSDLGTGFKKSAASTTLSLDPDTASLVKSRPKARIPAQRSCQALGCYCPPSLRAEYIASGPEGHFRLYLSMQGVYKVGADQSIPPRAGMFRGIPLGDMARDDRPLRSSAEFEQMLGDGARSNLAPGLFGLFLPRA